MKKKDVLVLLVPAFLLVLFWIGFSVYHNLITSTISETVSVQIAPISPDFDAKTIQDLKNRVKTQPIFQAPFASASATPTQAPTPTVATRSATPTPIATSSAQASEGGTLR